MHDEIEINARTSTSASLTSNGRAEGTHAVTHGDGLVRLVLEQVLAHLEDGRDGGGLGLRVGQSGGAPVARSVGRERAMAGVVWGARETSFVEPVVPGEENDELRLTLDFSEINHKLIIIREN